MIEPRKSAGIAVVTGASSGIGEAAAMQLSAAGFHLVLIARRRDRLEKLQSKLRKSGGQADFICSDLSQEESYSAIADQVKNIGAPIDVLLNNAGFGWYGFGDEMPWSVAKSMLAVNVQAVTGLTLQFLPEMKRINRGHIINVGSIVASIPSQGVALYGATKALAFCTLALALGLYGYLAYSMEFTQDDAYISYRYARNLVEGVGLVYNPGEYVEGFTNLLWTLLVAAGLAVGLEAKAVAPALGLASGVALLVATFGYARTGLARQRAWLAALAPALVLCSTAFPRWSTSGMETRLFGFLVLGAALLVWSNSEIH